jgi:hypothetical protein
VIYISNAKIRSLLEEELKAQQEQSSIVAMEQRGTKNSVAEALNKWVN